MGNIKVGSVGSNATIVSGVTIGLYAFVAAGAGVSKDVPDYELMLGVPAKHARWINRHGHRLTFGPEGLATCPESGLCCKLGRERMHCLDLDEEVPLPESMRKGQKPYAAFKLIGN